MAIDARRADAHPAAMLPFGYPSLADRADPFLMLLAGLALDAVAGEMPWLFRRIPHPVALIGAAIALLERKLNRPRRAVADLRLRGGFVVLVLTVLLAACGAGIQYLTLTVPFGWALEVFVIAVMLAQKSLYQHVAAVADGLGRGGLAGGREAVARICGRDPQALDRHGVARAAIESCAENFADGVVAPVFWYVVFGLPGLLVYKTVNTLDSMIGHRSERYHAFGFIAAKVDDLANLLPARLSGLLVAMAAAFVPTARPLAAFATMLRDARKHRSPNSGWPEAAMAGALGLALAGPRRYPGYMVDDGWIGAGRQEAEGRDIALALSILSLACVLNAGLVVAVSLVNLHAEELAELARQAVEALDWL